MKPTPEMLAKDGPVQKFHLIKEHGAQLVAAGYEPKTMSCAELRDAIAKVRSPQ